MIKDWMFQTCCIDKPCMQLYNVCPVKSECDTLKECEKNWRFLIDNPDVAERNKKNRERIKFTENKDERERVLKIALGLIKHEGFLDIGYDEAIVTISDVERCFDAIRKVDDVKMEE
jgi:hypothetical protein